MKVNSGKINILFSRNGNASDNINDNTIIYENNNELLVIILNSELSFEDQIKKLCKKQVKNPKKGKQL